MNNENNDSQMAYYKNSKTNTYLDDCFSNSTSKCQGGVSRSASAQEDGISDVVFMLHVCCSCFSVLPGLFHSASRTVQEFIFKTETHKLTLLIKGTYLFFLQQTLHSICLTLLLVYQTNHWKRELLQSRLE